MPQRSERVYKWPHCLLANLQNSILNKSGALRTICQVGSWGPGFENRFLFPHRDTYSWESDYCCHVPYTTWATKSCKCVALIGWGNKSLFGWLFSRSFWTTSFVKVYCKLPHFKTKQTVRVSDTLSHAHRVIKARKDKAWIEEWEKFLPSASIQSYKDLGPKPSNKAKSTPELKLKREVLGWLIAVRSGHGHFADYH